MPQSLYDLALPLASTGNGLGHFRRRQLPRTFFPGPQAEQHNVDIEVEFILQGQAGFFDSGLCVKAQGIIPEWMRRKFLL